MTTLWQRYPKIYQPRDIVERKGNAKKGYPLVKLDCGCVLVWPHAAKRGPCGDVKHHRAAARKKRRRS